MRCAHLVIILGAAVPSRAAFEDLDLSPRTLSLGGASAGLARGPAGAAYNAAGLADIAYVEADLAYLRWFEHPAGRVDLSDLAASLAFPTRVGGEGGIGLQWRSSDFRALARDREAGASYARRAVYSGEAWRLDAGGRIRLLRRETPAGETKNAVSADLGTVWVFGRRQLGVSILNLNQPGVSVAGYSDRAPRILKLGLAEELRGLLLALDWTRRASSGAGPGGSSFSGGVERWWSVERLGAFAVRTGINLGDRGKFLGLGLGYRRFGSELAYAAGIPLASGGRMNHSLGLSFRFGGADLQDEYESLLKREIESRKELQVLIDRMGGALEQMREDLLRSEAEVERLGGQPGSKREDAAQNEERLRSLQALQLKIREDLKELEKRREEARSRAERPPSPPGPQEEFKREWAEYQDLAEKNVPPVVLRERLTRLIKKYRGKGVDLGPAHQELLRRLETP